jgi:hypothetical protein
MSISPESYTIDEIKIDRQPRERFQRPSKDDPDRTEMLWEQREESVLLRWCDECEKRTILHRACVKRNKTKYALFGIPTMLIPIVLGGVHSIVPCHSLAYGLSMMAAGLFSGVNLFFNFGKKEQSHFDFMNKFEGLSNEIQAELCKPKRHRIPCDVYLEKIKQQYGALLSQSPML